MESKSVANRSQIKSKDELQAKASSLQPTISSDLGNEI
jgi:hypothetical protein